MAVGKGSLSRAAKAAGRTEEIKNAPEEKKQKTAAKSTSNAKKQPAEKKTPAKAAKKTAVEKTAAKPAEAKIPVAQPSEVQSSALMEKEIPAEGVSTVMVPDPQVEKVISHIKCDLPIYLL